MHDVVPLCRPQAEPGSIRPRSLVPPKVPQAELLKEVEPAEEDQQQYHEQIIEKELHHGLPRHAADEMQPHELEHDVAVECAEGESWDEEAEECRAIK